jgi:hypothetical protein
MSKRDRTFIFLGGAGSFLVTLALIAGLTGIYESFNPPKLSFSFSNNLICRK